MLAISSKFVSPTVDHLRLQTADASSVRIFLSAYAQYDAKLYRRERQLVGQNAVWTKAAKPGSLKVYVDTEWLQSTVALGFIDNVTAIEDLMQSKLSTLLISKSEESREILSLENLDKRVSQELHMNMPDAHDTSRIQDDLVPYHFILRRSGLSWIIKNNQMIAVYHVLPAIHRTSLQPRVESNLEFYGHNLRKPFKGFIKHVIQYSETSQLGIIHKQTIQSTSSMKNTSKDGSRKD